jgi:signal transduction histidine kinase
VTPGPFLSTRARLLGSMLVILVIVAIATFLAVRQALLASADDRVAESVTLQADEFREFAQRELAGLPQDERSGPGAMRALLDAQLAQQRESADDVFLAFVGDSLWRTRPPEVDPALAAELEPAGTSGVATSGEVETPDGDVKYSTVPVSTAGGQGATFVFASFVEGARDEMAEPIRVAAAVSIVVPLICSLLIWFLVGRAMAPLRWFAEQARQITEFDLDRRIRVRGGDEVAELERTFNEMLDRLEAAFASQKEFLAEVGHELRTPITIIRGHIELAERNPAERDATIELVKGELDRMSRIVDDLMLLARARRSDFLRIEELDLDLLTHEIFANAVALGDRDWRLEHTGVGTMSADRQRLAQAMINLAENAVQHTRPGDWIMLGTSRSDTEVWMWVRDSGPGIGDEDRERIFDRFETASGAAGSETRLGLGLAIVRAVAEAHGGRVAVANSPEGGATFAIVVPVRAATQKGEP